MQTLAQSQADAKQSANAAGTAAPQEVTGTSSKSKAKSGDSDTVAPSSLAFIPQSLAAAMAGIQPPNPGQPISETSTGPDDGSTDAVSLASESSVQNIIADLTKGTAEGLKAATEAGSDLKSEAPATTAPVADGSNPAASAFQAHMSVSSHFQQAASTDATHTKVGAAVGTAAFNDELGGKITWMATQKVQSASLQLSPEHLGPVDVRISVQDGSASVSFNAAHADTRAALEQALPRLREMFATQGLTLSDANVSQHSPRGQAQKQPVAAISAIGAVGNDSTSTALTSVVSARLGLVDTYV